MKRMSALFLVLMLALLLPLSGSAEEKNVFQLQGVFSFGMTKEETEAILIPEYGVYQLTENQWEGLGAWSDLSALTYGGGITFLFHGEGPKAALAEIIVTIRDVYAGSEAFADPDAYSRAEPAPNASDARRDYGLIETALSIKYGAAFPAESSASVLIKTLMETGAQQAELLSRRQVTDAYGTVTIDHLLLADPSYSGLSVNVVCYCRLQESIQEDALEYLLSIL